MKQARRRNRGVPRGVQKHKIRRRVSDTGLPLIERISMRNRTRIHGLAELCWVYVVTTCSKLRLIPLKPCMTKQDHFEASSFWDQLLHYLVATVALTLFGHKIIVTVDVLVNEDISVKTYMCLCYILIQSTAASACSGSTIKSREMQGLINSWGPILQQLEEMTGKRPRLFNITSLSLKIITFTWLVHVIAFNASLFSLVFDALPVCLYPAVKQIGILDGNNLPAVFWQIVCYPLELIALLLPMVGIAFNVIVLVIGLEVMRVYCREIR